MDDEKTIINVKGVSVKAWQRAKEAADRNDETLGAWLSRAVNLLADAETGGREFVPGQAPMSHDQFTARISSVAELMQALAALQTATGRPTGKGAVNRVVSSLRRLQEEMDPAPAKEPRRPSNVLTLPTVVRPVGVD